MGESPLGKNAAYADHYAPDLLFAINRAGNRQAIGIGAELPFTGADIWNAWELSWLCPGGKPMVGVATIAVPADSASIVESKSLKLYLNSFAMTHFSSAGGVAETITRDLGRCCAAAVTVELSLCGESDADRFARLPGISLDQIDCECSDYDVAADSLSADADRHVTEELHSHLLRSLCPVTGQPDFGSVLVRYRGPRIDRAGLLRYIVSFRQHQDYHESCVERMFLDIAAHCRPDELMIMARYQRRGGIDINPVRSSHPIKPGNPRLWRQ